MTRLARRIGLIGDVHHEDQALELVLDHFEGLSLDLTLCTGDIADGVGDFARCCRLLRGRKVDVVRGNHDRWLLAGTMRTLSDALPLSALEGPDRTWLPSLPSTREYGTIAGTMLLCHGTGDDDMSTVLPDDFAYGLESNDELQRLLRQRRYRLVVSGHSHRRMVRLFDELTLVNAGTLAAEHSPCCSLIDLENRCVRFWDINARRLLVEAEFFDLPAASQSTANEE
jgi:predicted phosphodiesterase